MSVFVIGASKTRFGPVSNTLPRLAQEAIVDALADAGLKPADLQAFVVANFLGGPNEGQLHLNAVVAGLMPGVNIPSWRVEAACASGGVAVHQACLLLGAYDPIMVVGVERLSNVAGGALAHNIGMAGDVFLDQVSGLTFPANYALVAQRYFQEYGGSASDLSAIALKNHANANQNPKAHFYRKRVTQSDIDAGALVASPLRLFDCCPISDGAAAIVLSSKPKNERSIRVLGSAVSSDVISIVQRQCHTSFTATKAAARDAYKQAGLGPEDIDFAEVHDCFTIAEVVAIEDLGFASPGTALDLTKSGATSLSGERPINSSGGLKAGGHAIGATGVGQIYELVKQLRGECGTRQVEGAQVGLAQNVGGIGGTAAVHILGGI